MKSPLLALAACFALGIALGRPEQASLPGLPLLLGCGLCLLAGLVALRAGKQTLSFLAVLAGFVAAGATAARLFEFRFPPNHASHLAAQGVDLALPLRLEGLVASNPFRTASGLQFDLDLERLESGSQFRPVTGRVRLHLNPPESAEAAAAADALQLEYGDSIRATARLHRPRVYQNPGSFNFRRWMESIEDLYWVGTIQSPLRMEKLRPARASNVASLLERVRRRLLDGIGRMYPPWSVEGRNGAVLKAVLLGDRSSLDSDTLENFRKAGLYHLLVIAGLHVGLLAMLAAFLLRLLRLGETWRSALVLLFLLAYACLVEQRASTLRATVMITLYLLARFFYRQHAALNAVGAAALILLVDRPAWLFEAGFQLSFSAALVIVALVVPILEHTTEPYRRALAQLEDVNLDPVLMPRQAELRLDLRNLINFLRARLRFMEAHPRLSAGLVTGPARVALWTANLLLFSAILQLGLLLPMAEIFHRASYAGIALNALAIPVMTLLLALALPAAILAAVLPGLGPWLGQALAPVMSALFALTDLPHLPAWLSYRVPEPPGWVAWGFAISLVVAAWSAGRRALALWASLATLGVFAILISLHPFPPRLPRGLLEVTALDCGSGNALFLVLPDRTTLLVDACASRSRPDRVGGLGRSRWDPGEEIVSPYLWWRGIKKVDIVLLSDARELRRAGSDPLGAGVGAVIRNFRVGEFWQAAGPATPATLGLLDEVRRRGISVRQLAAGDVIARGTTSVQVLWPPPTRAGSNGRAIFRLPLDEASLVVRIARDEASVLLPGDASGRVQEALTRLASSPESRVLGLTRHAAASLSSSDFLARVSPRVVLLTGEALGLRALTDSERLDRLRAAGARVFRTDLEGAVTVEMKGSALTVRTYRTSAGAGTAAASAGKLTLSVP
jgi:competence protein ComEC